MQNQPIIPKMIYPHSNVTIQFQQVNLLKCNQIETKSKNKKENTCILIHVKIVKSLAYYTCYMLHLNKITINVENMNNKTFKSVKMKVFTY